MGSPSAYPRSSTYEADWVIAGMMGPNPLWLAEALIDVMPFEPEMRVLDLGCGKALTSIFLAKEYGVRVWAADLWITPGENWSRIRDAGLTGQVYPLSAEAHALPFADGFFDAIVSLDAYHYFGTADLYLGYLLGFLRPGGRIGIVVPGFRDEPIDVPPESLKPQWDWQMCSFHSPAWWRRHWEKTGLVTVDVADTVPGGRDDWIRWNDLLADKDLGSEGDGLLLDADKDEELAFPRIVATARA